MKEGMLQVQLLVPSINADATVTANIKCDEELDLELKSEIKVMETTSEQKVAIKYGTSLFLIIRKQHICTNLYLYVFDWFRLFIL